MWSGIMIFSSVEANDTTAVTVLTVMVALMTTFMMVLLIGLLLRECLHENKADVVEAVEKILKLKKRISVDLRGIHLHEARNEDLEEGSGADVSEIELRPRTWSQPVNPALNAEEKNKSGGFMKAAPPAPVKKTSEESEQIRKGRLKSLNARRHSKEKNKAKRDVAYSNPMKKRKKKKKGTGNRTDETVEAEMTILIDEATSKC